MPLFNRPTKSVDRYAIDLKDILRIDVVWNADMKVERYDVVTAPPAGSPPGTLGIANDMKRVDTNPQRLLYLDGEPVTTCSTLYTPLQHADFYAEVEGVLRKQFPSMEASYFEGQTKWQRLGTYLLEKDVEVPFDPAMAPERWDFYMMVSNSMDMTCSINVSGVWKHEGVRLVGNHKTYHHARTGDAVRRLIDQSVGYIQRVALSHRLEPAKWVKLRAEPAEDRFILEIANRSHLTKKECARLEAWGITLRLEDGEYVAVERIPGALRVPQNAWDLLLMFSDASEAATSTWREWEACQRVSKVIREVVFG